ncbi:MAG TPA: branched-chain amino acid ABC transporter permease [Candidatus Dormibacteraeota bacterium]|nr:branched-chain amino acid ABC transporter permease [Candidatus Dormibacteraeota bacterium]
MTLFLQQVVSGLAAGGAYASLALALVLIYSAMGLVNFAQGEFAMFATFIAYTLMVSLKVPYVLAFVLAVAIAMIGAAAIERFIVRPFERGPQLSVVIVTLALLSIVNGMAGFIYGYVPRAFPTPFAQTPLVIGGVFVSIQDLGVIGVTIIVLGLIYVLFNRTKLGLAMRTASLYPDSAQLLGVSVGGMLAIGWGLASGVGAVSGILLAPGLFLEPNMMQQVIIYAFAAAVLGGIESPVGAVVGGLMLGVLLALVGAYIPALQDLRLAVALLLIVVMLVVRPTGLFGHAHTRRV